MSTNFGVYDFRWVRGTTEPLIVGYTQNGAPLPLDDARLSVYDKTTNVLIFRLSYADNPGTGPGTVAYDIVTGRITFHPSAEMTRALVRSSKIDTLPAKGKNKYEVELRDGAEEHVYLMGTIAGIGGYNDDEEIPS